MGGKHSEVEAKMEIELARLQAENAQLRAFVNSVYRGAQNSSQKTDLSAFLLYELGTEAAALLASLDAENTP